VGRSEKIAEHFSGDPTLASDAQRIAQQVEELEIPAINGEALLSALTEGPMTIEQLSKQSSLDEPDTRVGVERMVELGLVSRATDGSNGEVTLTSAGELAANPEFE
jgi:hypothetical protein